MAAARRMVASREAETSEQTQSRTEVQRTRQATSRAAETREQRQVRREEDRVRQATSRETETLEQSRTRIDNQRTRQVASRAATWASIEGEAFRHNPVNTYDNYAQFNIGRMDQACLSCGALKWTGEAPGMCCSGGKVSLTALQPPPEPLESLMSGITPRSKHFLQNIRKYNSWFQMTSFGATKEICEPGFMPTFKVQGQVYHRVGSLLPVADEEHKFLQIYFMGDEQQQAKQRCTNIPGTNQDTVIELQQTLHEHHSYVQIFKTALHRMPTDAYKVVIRADATPVGKHERRFNAPTTNEVTIVIVGDGFDRRDIILEKRNKQLQPVV